MIRSKSTILAAIITGAVSVAAFGPSPAQGAPATLRTTSPNGQAADPLPSTEATAPIVNGNVEVLGVPVEITAPAPVSYTGSAYRDDVSGQSESNSDAAIAQSASDRSPTNIDAW